MNPEYLGNYFHVSQDNLSRAVNAGTEARMLQPTFSNNHFLGSILPVASFNYAVNYTPAPLNLSSSGNFPGHGVGFEENRNPESDLDDSAESSSLKGSELSDPSGTVYNESLDNESNECSAENDSPEIIEMLSNPGECACDSHSNSKSIFREIVEDLFDELIIDHCFRAHYLFKVGSLVINPKRVESVAEVEVDKKNTLLCPNCKSPHEVNEYLNKLASCMNMKIRKSSRVKTRANYNDDANDEGSTANASKKTKRKRLGGKPGPKNTKAKSQIGLQSSESNVGNQTPEKKGVTSDQICGKKMKNGRICRRKKNCPKHFKKTPLSNKEKQEKIESLPTSSQAEEYMFSDVETANMPAHGYSSTLYTESSKNSIGIKLTIRNEGTKKKNSNTKS